MRYTRLVIVGMLCAILVLGCGPAPARQEPLTYKPVAGGGAVLTPAAVLLPIEAARQFDSPLSEGITQTIALPAESLPTTSTLTSTGWATFTLPSGLSIEYPANWRVRTIATAPYNYYFDSPQTIVVDGVPRAQVMLEVYPYPMPTDPYSWAPNEGGYEVHWGTPISATSTTGFLFVWGSENFEGREPGYDLWRGGAGLMAMFYSKQNELEVWLTGSFDNESTLLAQQIGLAATVAERYPIFDHMMKSIRFLPAGEATPATPTAAPGSPD